MTAIAPAVPDLDWLEPEDLYFTLGEDCKIERPIFQGDIITDVPLPLLPKAPPAQGIHGIEFVDSIVMVIPHPCQCYYGDKLRPSLTVAPVTQVLNFDNFGEDRTGKKDCFALPDLYSWKGEEVSYVANFGKIQSVPNSYLVTSRRIACLSHMGLGLLSKRFIQFQSRVPSRLGDVMATTEKQWNEAFLMQAWVQKNGKLKGFSSWMRGEVSIPSISNQSLIRPGDYLTSSLPELLEIIEKG